jgi:hypothetical protein
MLEKLPEDTSNNPLMKLLSRTTLECLNIFQTPVNVKTILDYLIAAYHAQLFTIEERLLFNLNFHMYEPHIYTILEGFKNSGIVKSCKLKRSATQPYPLFYLADSFDRIGTLNKDEYLALRVNFVAKLFSEYHQVIRYILGGTPNPIAPLRRPLDKIIFSFKLRIEDPNPVQVVRSIKINQFDVTPNHELLITKVVESMLKRGFLNTEIDTAGNVLYYLK